MATGANRVPLGRLNPAMTKKKADSRDGEPGLLSQHRPVQRQQPSYPSHQPAPPQQLMSPQQFCGQSYQSHGGNSYMQQQQQPPLPPMSMQPPLPPSGNSYPPPPPPQPPQPPPPPPQMAMQIHGDESHQQMLDYMQRIPQRNEQRAGKVENSPDEPIVKKKRRRSRWGNSDDKTQIPGMPVALPGNLTVDQQKQYLLHFKIEEISIKLRSGNLGIPDDPDDRSPSPEPIYNCDGKRLNTRDFRVRKILEEERHSLIQQAYELNQEYKPPPDYKPPSTRIQDKVMIPQDQNPTINFIGLLIGPRGNTLKKTEKDTNCKIIIRGKGSVKEGKVGRPGGPLPGEDEPLHALVTGPSLADVKKAVDVMTKIIKEGIECPESANELRRMQLRELAALNGTLIEEDMVRCRNCGGTDHRHWECTEQKNVTNMVVCSKCGGYGHVENDCVYQAEAGEEVTQTFEDKVKMDEEYMSLMVELQGGNPAASAAARECVAAAKATMGSSSDMRPAVNMPWNPPMSSSSDPPSLLGKPPAPHSGGVVRMPTAITPLMSTSIPQPLMPPGSCMNSTPSQQRPLWMNNSPQMSKPGSAFSSQNHPSNTRSPLPPMPNMMSMQGMSPMPSNSVPPPPPPGSSSTVSYPMATLPKPSVVSASNAPWHSAPSPWQSQMGQSPVQQGYMMQGMAGAYPPPPPPPPPPGGSSAPLPPWASAPPPPPPPPPSS